ncbi:MAG: AtaL-like protein [Telluria sp.]
MKFEHLIEINDLLNPLMDTITREQLWRGLVMRAESPKTFVPQVDEAIISERTDAGFSRSLRYGDLVVCDHVVLKPQDEVRYNVPQQGEIGKSTLVMSIEEPAAERLFVRFSYDDHRDAEEDKANEMYDDFRRSAYQEADIDTVRILRELAAAGRLDASLLN